MFEYFLHLEQKNYSIKIQNDRMEEEAKSKEQQEQQSIHDTLKWAEEEEARELAEEEARLAAEQNKEDEDIPEELPEIRHKF